MTASAGRSVYEHRIGPSGNLHVRLMSGSVSLRAVDGDIARVRERNGKSLTEAFRIDAGEDRLALTSDEKGIGLEFLVFSFGRRFSFDLDIEVPHAARVTVESASAEIAAAGLAGPLHVRTASGDITLDAIRGNLELDAVSGTVRIDAAAPLDVRARTISGDLALRAPKLGRATIESTSGDIRIDALLDGRGPFEIQTVSGDATIVGRSGIRVEARTVTGDLRSDLPHRRESARGRKMLIVGDGSTVLGFRSVSGDLRVTAPRDSGSSDAGMSTATSGGRDATSAPLVPHAPLVPRAPLVPQAPLVPPDPFVPPAPRGAEAADVPAARIAADEAESAREAGHEVARLDILRALERGDMSVEAAMERIAAIEEA